MAKHRIDRANPGVVMIPKYKDWGERKLLRLKDLKGMRRVASRVLCKC